MAHVLLLDTSSLVYRAFFALPVSITGPHGRSVNAVRGVLDMTARLVVDRRPAELLHVLDDEWRPAPRVAAYPGYKGTRREDPDELPWQFELLEEVLDAFGLARVVAPGWEADDAIGTLCERADAGDVLEVVTGDRDLLQLVRDRDPTVRVLFTVKGVSELTVFDEAAVQARFEVPAARYADFATLRGDPSDGLPGVKGVGEKSARRLVRDYPSLPALLDAAASLPPALRTRLREAAGYLEAMREVVPVRRDVTLQRRDGRRDDARLDVLAEQHGLQGPVGRLREALGA